MNKIFAIIFVLALAMISAASAVTPTLVTGQVKDASNNPVSGASVLVTCNGGTVDLLSDNPTLSDGSGFYYVSFDNTLCAYGNSVSVTATKGSQSGTNNVPTWCAGIAHDGQCPIDVALVDVSIPEFTLVAGGLAMLAGLGIVLFRRN